MASRRERSEEARYREIYRRLHSRHPTCLHDEWLSRPCMAEDGTAVDRPIIWSRRNGPWRRVGVLWVGAAPGNAGGMGDGELGAHGTRIPFGGDVAGANLDVLLGTMGLSRNETFIVAAFNRLPGTGGGEPRTGELTAPIGEYGTSIAVLADSLIAAGPTLVIALGNVALRTIVAAARTDGRVTRLPGLERLRRSGMVRNEVAPWPADVDSPLANRWRRAWPEQPLPQVLWLMHPSAQNMSPFAGSDTAFHRRMREAVAAVRRAATRVPGVTVPPRRPDPPTTGIYALPEWRDRIAAHHARLDGLWRERGV